MNWKDPKNTEKISWTKHSIEKMKFYGLTPQRVLRVLRKPHRCQEGVAEKCTACMQSLPNKVKSEIWLMYKEGTLNGKPHKKIITAWRYPAVSPIQDEIPIPQDILEDIGNMEFLSL